MNDSNSRLFTAPMANIYIFKKLRVQVEHTVKAECAQALLWKCKITVFISWYIWQPLKQQNKSHSNLVERPSLHLKGHCYIEYCCCIHYICEQWEQSTGSMANTPRVYLLVSWWVSHRCKPSSGRYQRKGMLGRLSDVKRLMLFETLFSSLFTPRYKVGHHISR